MSNIIKLFTKLAQIDSVSGEEGVLADWIKCFLSKEGIEFKSDRNNMIYIKIPGTGDPKLFCAHMDTVEPGRGVQVIEKDGYLVSQGNTILSGDNKVALAAILINAVAHKNSGKAIEILLTVEEETNSGIKEVNPSWIKSRVGFVFDGGDGRLGWLALHEPSIETVVITIRGLATHASTPEVGIDALKVWTKSGVGQYLGQPAPQTTFNVGLISGGTAVNTMIQELILKCDIRSENIQEIERIKAEVSRCLIKSAKKYGAKINLDWLLYAPGYTIDTKSKNLQKIKSIYRQEKLNLLLKKTGGASDACFLNSIGIETFSLGDGVEFGHCSDERIKIKRLHRLEKIVSRLMMDFNS